MEEFIRQLRMKLEKEIGIPDPDGNWTYGTAIYPVVFNENDTEIIMLICANHNRQGFVLNQYFGSKIGEFME